MARKLRWDDPRCGREHFDGRAGVDWECGPDPNDITSSIPDEPWNEYKRKQDCPRTLYSIGPWRVTSFGLELLSDVPARYERYAIPADRLLDVHDRGPVYKWPIKVANEPWVDFDAFEGAFKKAVQMHCRRRPPEPTSFWDWYIAKKYGPREQPCLADKDMLDVTFQRARAIARKCRRAARLAA